MQDSTHQGSALLLGMVFSAEQVPKRGQEYRDRVRCQALQELGFTVRTLDNKHSDACLDNHCNANFADTRRMIKSISHKWGEVSFEHVILDYFMSPVGWARERWTDPLFTDTFPMLAKSGMLADGALIWLPNLQCIEESLANFRDDLLPYFNIRLEGNSNLNPLFVATENAENKLLMCPDLITNETQIKPILEHARDQVLFYVLELKPQFLSSQLMPYSKTERTIHSELNSGKRVLDSDPQGPRMGSFLKKHRLIE